MDRNSLFSRVGPALHMVVRPHILAIASMASLVFGWLFSGQFCLVIPALVAADWFVVNLLNRVVDLDEDARNGVPGTAFLAAHGRWVTLGTVAFALGVLGAGHWVLASVTPLRLLFHAIGVAYNYKVIPTRRGRTRFKEMYAAKNSSSSVLFVLSVIMMPLVGTGHAGDVVAWHRALWLTAFFYPLELTYEILFDLRDVDGDAAVGVPTYPVVHGLSWTYGFCAVLLLVSVLAPVLGYLVGPLRIRDAVVAAGAVQQALALAYARKQGITGPRVVNITYLGAGQLASYCVWVLAGLPVFDG